MALGSQISLFTSGDRDPRAKRRIPDRRNRTHQQPTDAHGPAFDPAPRLNTATTIPGHGIGSGHPVLTSSLASRIAHLVPFPLILAVVFSPFGGCDSQLKRR